MTLKEYKKIGESLYSGKLPNGLTVFVIPKQGFYKSYAFFAADYGGADKRYRLNSDWIDTPDGVAHFLEHKMFDSEDGDVLTKFSVNGASPNAYTSPDVTAYHFDCTEKFTENLEILLSFVSTPYFTPESVDKEQGIIAQEISMYDDDPDHCLYYGLMRSLFDHNPLRDSVAGTIGSIANITAETLYSCHSAFYRPSNMALCVVGDVAPSVVMDIAERVLPEEPGDVPERDYGAPETLLPATSGFSGEMEVNLPVFLAGCKMNPAPRGSDSLRLDLVSALALEVLMGHSSPLFFRLYGSGLVCNDFSATFDSAAGAAYTIFGGETRDPQRVFGEVCKEIRALSANGPDIRLYDRIKKAAIGSHIRMLNSFDAICGNITGGFFRGFDAFEAPEILASITIDEIAAFYRENLNPENMTISIINPK